MLTSAPNTVTICCSVECYATVHNSIVRYFSAVFSTLIVKRLNKIDNSTGHYAIYTSRRIVIKLKIKYDLLTLLRLLTLIKFYWISKYFNLEWRSVLRVLTFLYSNN